jgi:hypothetical protein
VLTIAGMLVFTNGCAEHAYEYAVVRGKVTTCEGKPAEGGIVVFHPVDAPSETGRPAGNPGRSARGVVGADGTFSLETVGSASMTATAGALTGRHRVSFEMPPTKKPALTEGEKSIMSSEEVEKVEAEFAARAVYEPLPCSAEITPGEITVAAGENTFDFSLPAGPRLNINIPGNAISGTEQGDR